MVPATHHGPKRAVRAFTAAWHAAVHGVPAEPRRLARLPNENSLPRPAAAWVPQVRASAAACGGTSICRRSFHAGLANRGLTFPRSTFAGIRPSRTTDRIRGNSASCTANKPADTDPEDLGAATSAATPVRVSQERRRDGREVVLVLRGRHRGLQFLRPADKDEGERLCDVRSHHTPVERPVRKRLRRFLEKVFLPTDFPTSVTGHYLIFASCLTIQTLFSTISRVLATQAMLLAIGLGAKSALPLAAVSAWVLKDGLGHLGGIAFGTLVNTRFDSDPKRYRFWSAVMGKFADIVSLLTLCRPEYFLLLSTLGSACGRISLGASTSCRAKIYETFCLQHNLGDLMRCSQSQSTAAQLLGTGIAAALGPWLAADFGHLLAASLVFSTITLGCAYKCSSVVQLNTLNVQRAELIFHQVIDRIRSHEGGSLLETPHEKRGSSARASSPTSDSLTLDSFSVLSTEEVHHLEAFVLPYRSVFQGMLLSVNPPIDSGHLLLVPKGGLLATPYTLAVMTHGSGAVDKKVQELPAGIAIWFHTGAKASDVIQGFFHNCLLRALLRESDVERWQGDLLQERSELLMQAWWPFIATALTKHGWRSDVAFLDTREDRIVIK